MRLSLSLLLGLVATFPALAQNSNVKTPVLGFVFVNAAGTINPIRGIPGAALIDEPLDLGYSVSSAAFSPGHDFALIVSADDSRFRLGRFKESGAEALVLSLEPPIGGRIVFSPLGHSALVYRRSGESQILTGLTGEPAVRNVQLPVAETNSNALAISDNGELLIFSAGRASTDPLWLVSAEQALQLPLTGVAVAAFRPTSRDVLAISSAGDVNLLRNPGPDAVYSLISSADTNAADPVAVRFAPDGASAYVATVSGWLTIFDLTSGTGEAIACGCRPETIEPVALKNVFRLTAISSSPLMLFEASKRNAHMWFVPPGRTLQERSGQ